MSHCFISLFAGDCEPIMESKRMGIMVYQKHCFRLILSNVIKYFYSSGYYFLLCFIYLGNIHDKTITYCLHPILLYIYQTNVS
jgi:hypothetical protein